ncbi:MAG: D-alanyl-D-alanine carboxypeptidase family protein [Bacillota bacterium]|nr:D-alanyl-D-alanine carboxypeptidase family protein [Bacillota bacterium]
MGKRFTKVITVMTLIAALTITWAVPSFATAEETQQPPELDSTSAILMDAETGEVLYEKNAYEKRDPASITKILNCLVVLDNLDMDQEVTVSFDPETEGSVMHLQKGETISVRNLVYGMMIWSANDAAEVLGKLAGGDIETFCSMMNEKAAEFGAKDTVYTNPNGLNPPGRVNNITTAYDIAVISAGAMKNTEFAEIVSTPSLTIPATNKSKERKHKSSNRCLWDTKTKFEYNGVKTPLKYDGCKGIKTGYSSTAGDCFVGYAERGKTHLIVVVLNASHEEPKFHDAIKLWDYGFDNFKTYYAARSGKVLGKQKVTEGSLREVDLGTENDLAATVAKDYKASENTEIKIELNNEKIKAPVSSGTVLGSAVLVDENGRELARQDLIALETAEQGGPLSRIGIADEDVPVFVAVVFTAFALVIVIVLLKRKKKKTTE